MVKKTRKPRIIIVVFGVLCSFGFKIQQKFKWSISADDPTVWLDVDPEILAYTFGDVAFSDGSEILDGVAEADQVRTILGAIIADYNNVTTSYLRFALPDSPETEDSAIDTFGPDDRKIKISFGTPQAFGASGYASFNGSGSKMNSCSIVLLKAKMSKAQDFKSILTHELGHCLGLDHNHSDRDSIMSYDHPSGMHFLGLDDRMAVTYLYPVDDAYAKEVATLGMSCSQK